MSANFLNRFKNKVETMDVNGPGDMMKNSVKPIHQSIPRSSNISPIQSRSRMNTDAIKKNFLDFPATYGQIVNPQYMTPPPMYNYNAHPLPYMPYQQQYQQMPYYHQQVRSKSNYRVS